MVYQGSKSRIAKDIVPIIQGYIDKNEVTSYIEPFVGGANVIDKIKCNYRGGSDINKNLITLLNYAKYHPTLPIAFEDCPDWLYKEVRDHKEAYAEELVALVGYCASYGGRYFDGGYARDRTGQRNIYKERLKNLRNQAPLFEDIVFINSDYKNLDFADGSVVYCDPPYRSKKGYNNSSFNHEEFYEWCKNTAKDNIVIISECDMPDDFECIWRKERKVMQKSDRTTADRLIEKLFVVKGGYGVC